MTYDEARRQVRKLLGEKAELRELKKTDMPGRGAPAFRHLVGYVQKGRFYPLEAGNSWAEAVENLKKRMENAKS